MFSSTERPSKERHHRSECILQDCPILISRTCKRMLKIKSICLQGWHSSSRTYHCRLTVWSSSFTASETSDPKTASFFICEWCNWCQGLFFEMFFNSLIWFRGRELHFVQVRVKASCQTEIPKWRYKWTVDITGIRCVFIRFDSPLSTIPSTLSLSPYLWWPWKAKLCQTVAADWPAEV